MTKKILVTYASKQGSTAEVAQTIADVLAQTAHVDVLPMKMVSDLSGYDAAVVGSAIRVGSWLPEALDFVREQRAALRRLPVAYFTVCMTLIHDTADNRDKVRSYIKPARAVVEPVSVGMFAGRLDYRKLSPMARAAVDAPEGDYRDWDRIMIWAQDLPQALFSEAAVGD